MGLYMKAFKEWWRIYKRKRALRRYIKRLWGFMEISNAVERKVFMQEIVKSHKELDSYK